MKKKFIFPDILLPVLPLLGETPSFKKAFVLGGFIAAAFSVLLLFFKIFQPFFPARLFRFSLILGIAALSQIAWYFGNLSPFAGAALFLLLGDFEKLSLRNDFWTAAGVWLLLSCLGIFQKILGSQFSIFIFAQPAGSFLLLAGTAILFQESQNQKREIAVL